MVCGFSSRKYGPVLSTLFQPLSKRFQVASKNIFNLLLILNPLPRNLSSSHHRCALTPPIPSALSSDSHAPLLKLVIIEYDLYFPLARLRCLLPAQLLAYLPPSAHSILFST